MVAEASTLVRASVEQVQEAVLDPDAYTQGDTKVAEIHVLERLPDGIVARIDGSLGPFRSHIDARYEVHPDRVDLKMLRGRLRGFFAVFEMAREDGGVRLTHREHYDFGYGPLDPVLDRVLKGWATESVVAEVNALKRAAERRSQAAG